MSGLLDTLQSRAALIGATVEAAGADPDRPAYIVSHGAVTARLSTSDDVDTWLDALAPRLVKLCPFCNRSAALHAVPKAHGWFRVRCDWHHCGGTTWAICGPVEAVATWNRRATSGEA